MHRPILIFISLMCVHVMSAEFALSLNISQNKWTLEEGDGGLGGGIHAVPLPLGERRRLGEIAPCFTPELKLQFQLGDRSPRDT